MTQTLYLSGKSTKQNQEVFPQSQSAVEKLRARHERSTQRELLQSTLEAKQVRFNAELRTEREARHEAEQRLTEAENVIRDLETRLVHAALAQDEAFQSALKADQRRHTAEFDLVAERHASKKLKARLSNIDTATLEAAAPSARVKSGRRSGDFAIAKAVSLKGSSAMLDPKPVKWWLNK